MVIPVKATFDGKRLNVVHRDTGEPLTFEGCDGYQWSFASDKEGNQYFGLRLQNLKVEMIHGSDTHGVG